LYYFQIYGFNLRNFGGEFDPDNGPKSHLFYAKAIPILDEAKQQQVLEFFQRPATASSAAADDAANAAAAVVLDKFLDEKEILEMQLEKNLDTFYKDGGRVNPVIRPGVDQLKKIVYLMRNYPEDRRMMILFYNPLTADTNATLPACHVLVQFYISRRQKTISATVYMRSSDVFFGLPFNMASYNLLLVSKECIALLFLASLEIQI
jgi:thymidylate synthase